MTALASLSRVVGDGRKEATYINEFAIDFSTGAT
jgi:hypothetical protein